MKNKIYSVNELNNLIKEIFECSEYFKNISVKGEVSNFKGKNNSGHYYFKIKDNTSVISCVLFKYDSLYCETNIKDGDEITVIGNLSVYPPSGSYQLIIKKIEKSGYGDILKAKADLINKLNKEGLFDLSRKKKIPNYPFKIGLIVGKNSAASKDLEYNLIRRWPLIEIHYYYSLVQGKAAVDDLINNVYKAESSNLDLLIISRGGGSLEDLEAFDDERLIRVLSSIKTPFISAVGHEINKSIVDLISDKYASTPTAACEFAVPNKEEIIKNLGELSSYISNLLNNKITTLERDLNKIKGDKIFKDVNSLYIKFENKILSIKKDIYDINEKYFIKIQNNLNIYNNTLINIDPKKVLKKGYVIIKDDNNNIVNRSNELKFNKKSKIIFYDKELNVIINKDKE